ncbi:MAG: TIM barrel protein [Clostridiales bacterium]|jgi:hydroxypyruvate isomerase|nr:TIM barrel protein [Clostridiales bacterium]
MKYSLCLETVFKELDFYDRIALAADLGFDAIEFWDPARYDAGKIGRLAAQHKLPVAACCILGSGASPLDMPFPALRGIVERSIELAREFGCDRLICLGGQVSGRAGDSSQSLVIAENCKRIAELCERSGTVLVIEALNSLYDHKGYYLDSSAATFNILKAVGHPLIKMLFDCYHMQLMEGNLVNNIVGNIDLIGHFHAAGAPGRGEPFKGETNYRRVLEAIGGTDYNGYFGLEYMPSYESAQSLADVLKNFI